MAKDSKSKENIAEKAAKVREKAKEAAATKAKETAKAAEASKTVETTSSTPAKTTRKTAAPKENCFIEYSGKQISVADITENAKKLWKSENSDAISQINVYIKKP